MTTLHSDPRKDKINLEIYAPEASNPKAFYGLPDRVLFCSRCVISNQRPNSTVEHRHTNMSKKTTINFDQNNVCDACKVADQKQDDIDWEERRRELHTLCDKYRSRNGSYDCLVPGSGGKDSFYQSWILKYEFGMNPLTTTWAPHIHTEWGWRNFDRWIHSGFDNYLLTPNGRVKRLITRLAVENLLHPFQPFIFGQKSLAPKIAEKFNIPLIFYGENEAEYGNPIANSASAQRDYSFFSNTKDSDIYLGGTSIASLRENYGVRSVDLEVYRPSNPEDLRAKDIQVHYLGYYLKWHPQAAYYFAVENGGFEASPERTPGTYSKYNSIDDRIDDLHYYTTFIKFGIGRATYDASQEVRSNDIEREEGVALIRRYDGEFPDRFSNELMAYLSLPEKDFPVESAVFDEPIMDRDYFDALANRFRSPHLWSHQNDKWQLRHTIFDNI